MSDNSPEKPDREEEQAALNAGAQAHAPGGGEQEEEYTPVSSPYADGGDTYGIDPSRDSGEPEESQIGDGEKSEDWGIGFAYWRGEENSADDAVPAGSAGGAAPPWQAEAAPVTSAPGGEIAKKEEDEREGDKPMGILDHLGELRQRLTRAAIAVAVGFGICWAFVDQIFDVIVSPLLAILPPGTHAQYTTLPEAFFTRMEIAFVGGIFIASPFIFYQIWAFVAPGLYDEEKKYIIPIAILSAIFFITGGLFCYCIVFPFAFNFFISYSTPEIVMTPKISDYLSFVLKLIFAFGIIFEMPIFTLFLSRPGILTAAMMRHARRYAIVGIFVLAAILTPPDVVSQILMACPMLILYELSIGVAVIFGKKTAKKEKEEQAA